MSLFLLFPLVGVIKLNFLDSGFKTFDLFLKFQTLSLELFDSVLHLGLLLLSLQSLTHAVGDRALVERLVRLNRHSDFVSDSDE